MKTTLTSLGRETPYQISHSLKDDTILVVYADALVLYRSSNGNLEILKEVSKPSQAATKTRATSGCSIVLACGDHLSVFAENLESERISSSHSEEEIVSLLEAGADSFLAVSETGQVTFWTLSGDHGPVPAGQWVVECQPLFCRQDGKTVICAERGRLQERDPKNGMVLRTWPKSQPVVWGLNDSHDQHALTISESGTAAMWDLSAREHLFDFDVPFPVVRATFEASGLRGALLGADGEVVTFGVVEGGATHELETTEAPIVALTYRDKTLIGINENGEIFELSSESPKQIGGHWAGWATCSYFSKPDRVLVGTATGSVETFDTKGHQIAPSAKLHTDAVVALIPWRQGVVSIGADASVVLWKDTEQPQALADFAGRMTVDHHLSLETDTLWLALDDGLIVWLSMEDPEQAGEFQLLDRRIEEIRPAGGDGLIVLTDRGSILHLKVPLQG